MNKTLMHFSRFYYPWKIALRWQGLLSRSCIPSFFVLALSARAKLLKRFLTKGFFLPFVKFLIFQVLWTLPPEEGGSWMCQRTFPRLRRHKHLNPRPYNFCLEMYHLWMSELHIYCSIKAIPHRGNVLR